MRKTLKKWKIFLALILSVGMVAAGMPLTVLAAPTEAAEEPEIEQATEIDVEEEENNEEESEKDSEEREEETGKDAGEGEEAGNSSEEGEEEAGNNSGESEEEQGKDAEGGEEETEKDPESGEEEADQDSEDEEETEEGLEAEESEEDETLEEEEESVESEEVMLLSSASDFVINNDGVLTSYTGTDADVVIPEGTVEIAPYAFEKNKTIKTVTLPSSLKTIGTRAFYDCSSLVSVKLNEGLVTIGEEAFALAALGEKLSTGAVERGTLTIPGTVQNIGEEAFYNCTYLGTVIFEDGDTAEMTMEGVLGIICSCPELEKIVLPSRLTTISARAFQENKSLKEVILGDKIETIEALAFYKCSSLKSINFPSTVKTIDYQAFYNCSSLVSVNLNEGLVTIGKEAFYGVPFGEKLSTGAIELGTLIIPSTVQSIGEYAFTNCGYLGTVIFEDGDTTELTIESIYGTISLCPELIKIVLPSRLTDITSRAFCENKKLKEVILGEKVETIGERAFYKCNSLQTINFPASVKVIGAEAFSGCSSLGAVDLKEGLVTIGEEAFSGAALGEKLTTGKVELGTLTIPGTVQSIGRGAFYNCAYLGKVTFENSDAVVLTMQDAIYHGTFGSCPELTKVELPSRLTAIPTSAFQDDKKLSEVVLSDKIENIGDRAFTNCSGLKNIILPASVRTIGAEAFSGCSSLGAVDLKEGLVTIGTEAFSGAALGEKPATGKVKPGTLVIPSTVQSIGSGAFYNCAYLGKVIFSNGDTVVLTIDKSGYRGTFDLCPELTTVILPERITKLTDFTFDDNPKLQTLYIPEGVTEIADYAISKCPKLTIYGVSGSAAQTYANKNKIPFKSKDSLNGDFVVKSVKVTPGVIEKIGESAIGETIWLTATVLPDTAQNRAVTYASDDETVAAVDQNGLVTITGYGETRITVTTKDGGKTASCMVVVLREAIDERSDINEANVLFPKKKAEYSAVYTGEQIRPAMTVTYPYTDANGRAKTQTLKINVDYTISYRNNVNVGEDTASLTIRGIGEYKGVTTKTFTIIPKNIRNVTLSQVGDIVYGETPSVVVMDGTYELTKGKDYEVILTTEGSASEDTPSVLTVEGMGNYTGISKKSAKFNILKTGTDIQPIASGSISVAFKKLPAKGYTYNGKAQKPAVVVTDTSTGKRIAASNYKVIYTNNINAGTAAVRVVGVSKKGKGYYGISDSLTFEIKPKDFNKVKVSTKGLIPKAGTIEDIQKSVEEALTVKDGKHVLSTDEYEIDYGNIRSAGDIKIGTKYPITLTAKAGGNYVAGTQKTISIKFGQLNLASWTAKISVRIINAEQSEILLRYNGTLLEKGKDYTVVVKKDKKQETYTVTVKAVKNGAYKGSKTFKKLSVD